MEEQDGLSQWLQAVCRKKHLSLRQAAAKTGLSHGTIDDIIKGNRPLPETIQKLARGFGGNGTRGLLLEDRLLVLAGYKREELNQAAYLKIIPLLSPEYQHIIEVLVRGIAKVEGIEVSTSRRSRAS